MYSEISAPCLKTIDSRNVVLQGANVRVDIRDYLARTRMEYHFVNREDVNIEAVYTFALPIDGVLTDLGIVIGHRELKGIAVEKREALERYEDAISDGDSPVMLERLDSGLYSLNVGNIMPGEKAVVSVEFLEVLSPKAGEVRYELPTTLAPLYGDPAKRGLAPHQIPGHSIMADNRFSLHIGIEGCLATADILTPAHMTVMKREAGRVEISLSAETTAMDRDFILAFSSEALPRSFAVSVPDKDGHVVLAGFTPKFSAPAPARSIKIVVDCSGSMGGESILQARQALLRALDRLRPEDHFNIILFGSSCTALFNRQEPADATHLEAAITLTRSMDANMGGTEMGDALEKALASASPAGMPEDILLITDGQVWDMGAVAEKLAKKRHRVFCIGVGSAVERGVLSALSSQTKGNAIFVNVQEDMGKKVFEHFKRMTLTPAQNPAFDFGGAKPLTVCPENLPAVFDGDMVIGCAWFASPPKAVSFRFDTTDGSMSQQTEVKESSALANALTRFAASMKLETLPEPEATALAVEYNLMSPFTNFLAVLERAESEKTGELPQLRTVEHNIPRGWGGMVTGESFLAKMAYSPAPPHVHDSGVMYSFADKPLSAPSENTWIAPLLEQAIIAIKKHPDMVITFAMLEAWGVAEDVLDALRDILANATGNDASSRPTEKNVAFSLILIAAKKSRTVSRDDVRLLRKVAGKIQTDKDLEERIDRLVNK
ncbi:VIT domain-containing protein [Desulfomicrobium sp. ZS1]|uniref:VIT domain-containing protein n=1 Tax=Desulfomicrobium sp. ZS1 TaxID=2952228 RepID=UPI0020B3A890|nr:VIT domain-containing protein [Desulfomicrobium sp. ZS1]UTF51782.1 VIT domain-containing protein [Desulfomicrobium sp. ZS1]